ncbi:MAG: hypothetical protein HQL18_01505 [Candidatus Omnitrophica bacterium]|nr:hypothetical protein [Candidatus Omnitrophota bacterium]
MKRPGTSRVGTTLFLTYLFLARDVIRPAAVTGATRRVTPVQAVLPQPQASFSPSLSSSPPSQESSLPPLLSASEVVPVSEPVLADPGQTLVSAPAVAPPARVATSDGAEDKSRCRTFEGTVESVVEEGPGDGPRQVVELVNPFGERFKCVLDSGTLVYVGEDRSFPTRPVAPGDRLFVKYVLLKENTAVEARIN